MRIIAIITGIFIWSNAGAQPDKETVRLLLPVEHSKAFESETAFYTMYTESSGGKLADNPDKAFRVALELQRMAIKAEKPELSFLADYFLGRCYYFFNDAEKSIRCFTQAAQVAEKQKWVTEQAKIALFTGAVFELKRNYKQAEKYYEKAMDISKKHKITAAIQMEMYEKVAHMYLLDDVDNLPKSREIYREGLKMAEAQKDTGQMGVFMTKIAELDLIEKKPGSLDRMKDGIKYIYKAGTKEDLVVAYKDLGDFYYNLKENDSSLHYYRKCYDLRKGMGQSRITAITACDVAYMYGLTGKPKLLDQFADTALKYVQLDQTGDGKFYVYKWLADIYQITNQQDKALRLYKAYTQILDSTIKNTTDAALARQGLQMDFDSQLEVERLKREREQEMARAEKEYEEARSRIYLIGLFIVLGLFLVIFREFRRNRKQKRIIEKKNLEVIEQSRIIEQKNKEMTDSINYAQRIQAGLLSSKKDLFDIFPGSFLYYNPKDILSGDFYWFCRKNETVFVACGDCTGHGVPGALMSVLGINLLNDIVDGKDVREPAQILDQLRTGIIRSLNKDLNKGEYKDGMDIALLRINMANGECTYAGANNPAYHISGNELKFAYQGSKQPVGYSATLKPFDQHSFQVNKGDMLVLFTDGFPDQFGGNKGKKLMYKPFREIVMSVLNNTTNNREEALDQKFREWRGNNDQIDDICVMGIKI